MKKKYFFVFLIVLALSLFSLPKESVANEWQHYQKGISYMEKGNYQQAIIELNKAAALSPKASTYRQLAISYEKTGQYQKAAETYYKEAEVFAKLGDHNTAQAVKNKGDALFSEIDIFVNQPLQMPKQTFAKYEPSNGLYIGAYIEQGVPGSNGNKYQAFNSQTGKDHAIFFTYLNYGSPFPTQFAEEVKAAGGAIQIAWEPNGGLKQVQDNAYLRQFAKDAKASGIPIFLRYASEMNGSWVAWHGNPTLYKEKFQLVAKVMREEAPNVAMVWVPNSVPTTNIDPYYPGDAAVDWVGLNLYSVPFFNGNPNSPAEHVNPLDLLDAFYNKYAHKKPMMIGEYAASHFTSATNRSVTNFGTTKMQLFYHGIKMKYPRIKAAHWFNVDTINAININPDRRLNNFNLFANNTMLSTYKQTISDPYFLSDVANGPYVDHEKSLPPYPLQLNGQTVYNSVNILTYANTYDPYISKVVYTLNGKKLYESKQFPYTVHLNHNRLKSGSNRLVASVYDSKGKKAAEKTVTFKKGPKMTQTAKNTIQLFTDERMAFNENGAFQLLSPVYQKIARSYVPLRFISESIGATVGWNDKTKQITIKQGNKQLVLQQGSKTVYVNNVKQTIDAAPEVNKGTSFVPVRFIMEELGGTVKYDGKTRGIEIKF